MSTLSTAIADSAELKERIDRFQEVHHGIIREVRKVIVGQEEVIEQAVELASDGVAGRDRKARGLTNLARRFLKERSDETATG